MFTVLQEWFLQPTHSHLTLQEDKLIHPVRSRGNADLITLS